MKRTTAEANDNNRYTEGNPSLGIPATVVGAEEMNNIQEEIVNVVLDAGLTLDAGDESQLLDAINIKMGGGGTANGQLTQTVVNNQAAPQPITNFIFDSSLVKGFRALVDIMRSTDSGNASEIGQLFGTYNQKTATWAVELVSFCGDAAVVFSINGSGQVSYTSSNLAGTSYTGTVRVGNIFKLKA